MEELRKKTVLGVMQAILSKNHHILGVLFPISQFSFCILCKPQGELKRM